MTQSLKLDQFIKDFNNGAGAGDNNNKRSMRKVKNVLEFTGRTKKAAKDTEMGRKKDDAVMALNKQNAIRKQCTQTKLGICMLE